MTRMRSCPAQRHPCPAQRRQGTAQRYKVLRQLAAATILLGAELLLASGAAVAQAKAAAPLPPAPPPDTASTAPSIQPSIQSGSEADIVHVPIGRSVVLTSAVPLRRIYVGNPSVIQSYTSGQREVVLTAKTTGVSSLVLWETTGEHRLYTISADPDAEALRSSLADALPGADIHADTSGGKIFLSGAVPTDATADAAYKLASLYSKDVVSSLHVVPVRGKQVELKLKIIEVDRTRMEQFGLNFFSQGTNTSGLSTQQFGAVQYNPNPAGGSTITFGDPLNLFLYHTPLNAGITVKDLEEKQILQVLAEPTLTTMSGQQARFLSGGEFPFPIVQGGTANATAITIVFKPYGVKVDFTPTVNADGSIHLKVNPEVSTLDFSNAVTISGFTIPALSTRRAETEVEIKNGESFVVSGLLDHRTTDNLSKIPGIASIPILGDLFRSKNFNHSIVELVVIVTATVVDPLAPSAPIQEPKMAVPNMEAPAFDAAAKKAIQRTPLPEKLVKE